MRYSKIIRASVERGARLRLLRVAQLDSRITQEDTGCGRHIEGLCGRALGRKLEDPGPVGVVPQLDRKLVADAFGPGFQLEHVDGPQDEQVVELDSLRCVLGEEFALGLREQLAKGHLARNGPFDPWLRERALVGGRAYVTARHRVDFDDEVLRHSLLGIERGGLDRPELYDGIVGAALASARSRHDRNLVQREVPGVEEEDLAYIGVQRVDPERLKCRKAVLFGDGQLELDSRGPGEGEELADLIVVKPGRFRLLFRLGHGTNQTPSERKRHHAIGVIAAEPPALTKF